MKEYDALEFTEDRLVVQCRNVAGKFVVISNR